MRQRLTRIVIRFAVAIAIALAFGGLFKLYTDEQLSPARQQEVLIKAIPFVAVFVAVLLVYICLIVLLAVMFNNRVPQRAYRPIEAIIIAGILLGVVGLFQGWKLFGYEYGFLVLLIAVLAFIVWSHLAPMPASLSRTLPPLSRRAHLIGVIVGLVVWALVAAALVDSAKPQEPYGVGATLWGFKTDEEKAQIRQDAEDEYRYAKVPALVLVSLLPGALAYFAARELAASGPGVPVRAVQRSAERAGAPPG